MQHSVLNRCCIFFDYDIKKNKSPSIHGDYNKSGNIFAKPNLLSVHTYRIEYGRTPLHRPADLNYIILFCAPLFQNAFCGCVPTSLRVSPLFGIAIIVASVLNAKFVVQNNR